MLKSFLSLGASPEQFKNYSIYQDMEFLENHCGKYLVVFLDLKECKAETWEAMYVKIWRCIQQMILRHEVELSDVLAGKIAFHVKMSSFKSRVVEMRIN